MGDRLLLPLMMDCTALTAALSRLGSLGHSRLHCVRTHHHDDDTEKQSYTTEGQGFKS